MKKLISLTIFVFLLSLFIFGGGFSVFARDNITVTVRDCMDVPYEEFDTEAQAAGCYELLRGTMKAFKAAGIVPPGGKVMGVEPQYGVEADTGTRVIRNPQYRPIDSTDNMGIINPQYHPVIRSIEQDGVESQY